MIKKQSGYYYCIDDPSPIPQPSSSVSQSQPQPPKVALQIIGNLKQYITHVANEVNRIKQLKKKQKQEEMSKKLVLDAMLGGESGDGDWEACGVKLRVRVPEEVYRLEQRIARLEEKIVNDEIVRQKVQRKGKLSQRAKLLSLQLQKLSQKSPQTLSTNIQTYFKTLQQKQQQNKALFLYQTFTKTNTLTEQIQMLDIYLSNLNTIMMKFKALPPMKTIVGNQGMIREKREKNRGKIEELYRFMCGEYEKVVKEIDSI